MSFANELNTLLDDVGDSLTGSSNTDTTNPTPIITGQQVARYTTTSRILLKAYTGTPTPISLLNFGGGSQVDLTMYIIGTATLPVSTSPQGAAIPLNSVTLSIVDWSSSTAQSSQFQLTTDNTAISVKNRQMQQLIATNYYLVDVTMILVYTVKTYDPTKQPEIGNIQQILGSVSILDQPINVSQLSGTSFLPGVAYVVPIQITNTQNTVPNFYQQTIEVNSLLYSIYESAALDNINFQDGHGNLITSWLESGETNTSTSTIYQVLLKSGVPQLTTITIYLCLYSTSTNVFDGITTGAEPNYTGTYGQYDNGKYLFEILPNQIYENFSGTSLPSSLVSTGGETVNNGISIPAGCQITTVSSFAAPYIFESDAKIQSTITGQTNNTIEGIFLQGASNFYNGWQGTTGNEKFSMIEIGNVVNNVVATIATGGAPAGLAISPSGGRAYVVNAPDSQHVSVINTSLNTVIATITGQSGFPFNNANSGIAITPNGNFAYSANWNTAYVSVINLSTNTTVATILTGIQTYDVAITPSGSFAYVTENLGDCVDVIDTTTNTITAIVAGFHDPQGIAITPSGSFAYVANAASNNVAVIDTSTNTIATTVAVGAYPMGVAITPNSNFVYVANNSGGSISVIDTSTNTISNTIVGITNPSRICFNPSGTYAYVTSRPGNIVYVINTSTYTIVDTVIVGTDPWGIAVTPNGNFVYVSNSGSGTISVIAITSTTYNTPFATQPLPTNYYIWGLTMEPSGLVGSTYNYLNFTAAVGPLDTTPHSIGFNVDTNSNHPMLAHWMRVRTYPQNNIPPINSVLSISSSALGGVAPWVTDITLVGGKPINLGQTTPSDSLSVVQSAFTSSGSFQTTVSNVTAIQLPTHPCKLTMIKNDDKSTNDIFLGDSSVTTTTGFRLAPTAGIVVEVSNTNEFYAVTGVGIATVDILFMN